MSEYMITPISEDFKVLINLSKNKINISASDEEKVDLLWCEAKERLPHLFNGQIFTLDELHQDKIVGTFIEYKYLIANLLDSYLNSILFLKTIGVSSITRHENLFLLGRRSLAVTEYPNCLELIPSGGIDIRMMKGDSIDLQKAILQELEEETGISALQVKKVSPLVLIQDFTMSHVEICFDIEVDPFLKCENLYSPQREYEAYKWLTKQQLGEYVSSKRDSFVPISIVLFDVYCKKHSNEIN